MKELIYNDESKFYYCTKKIKFPINDVVNVVYDFFKSNNTTSLHIHEIYEHLCSSFNVKGFNLSNLMSLFSTKTIVPLNTVQELYIKYNVDSKVEELYNYKLIEYVFIKKRKILKELISNLGVETLKDILVNGLTRYIAVLDECCLLGEPYTVLQLVDKNNDKPLNYYNTKAFCELFSMFDENEWILLLEEEQSLREYVDMFIEDKKSEAEKIATKNLLQNYATYIHPDNIEARVKYLFKNHISQIFLKYNIIKVKDIANLSDDIAIELFPYKDTIVSILKYLKQSVKERFNEKYKYLVQRVNKDYVPHSLWENYVSILEQRASGLTLLESGKHLDLTRERVRQIEKKYMILFDEFCANEGDIVNKLRAFVKNPLFISNDDIVEFFSFNPKIFKFLLQNKEDDNLYYLEEIDKFYYQDEYDWYKEITDFVETMPNHINKNSTEPYVNDCLKILNDNFYSKTTFRLSSKFKQLMKKYYPHEIELYNKEFLTSFKKHYLEMFNESELKTDHSITSTLMRICMLVGRGKYILNEKVYMSEELADKIYNYIITSEREIFLTNTLFAIFKDDLVAEGITNKYFMQGAFKQRIGNKLFFKRDYISTSDEISCVYNDIAQYVKDSKQLLTYEDIRKEFIGATDIVLFAGLAQEGILNFRKKYIHIDNLDMSDEDCSFIKSQLQNFVSDSKIHHIRDLFAYIKLLNSKLLDKLYIDDHFALFSLIEYLFEDEFEMRRPYIAQKDIVIENQVDRINEYVNSFDELEINMLLNFLYDNKLHVYRISEYIDSLSDYVLKDENSIIALDKTNLNKYNTAIAEKMVLKAMGVEEFVFADNLSFYSLLPKEVKWNKWILYSALNKFGEELKAIPSDTKFRSKGKMRARPLIIRKDIPAKDIDEFIAYLKAKLNINDDEFYKYLKQKQLI